MGALLAAGIGALGGIGSSLIGGQDQTVTSQTQLDPNVQRAQADLLTRAGGLSQTPQAFFPGATVAPQSEFGFAGQQLALGQLPRIAEIGEAQRLALLQGLGEGGAQDPRTLAQAEAVTQPIISQFQEQILPALQSQAISQGAFGGSRQNINEGIASGKVADAALRARAGVFENARLSSLRDRQALLGLAPSVTQQQLAPSGVLQGIGGQQEAREQALINAERERFGFEQQAPGAALSQLASLVSQAQGGTTTTQTTPGAQTNPLLAALGGGVTGLSLFNQLQPPNPNIGQTVTSPSGGVGVQGPLGF